MYLKGPKGVRDHFYPSKFTTKQLHGTTTILLLRQPWTKETLQRLPPYLPWCHLVIHLEKTWLESKNWAKSHRRRSQRGTYNGDGEKEKSQSHARIGQSSKANITSNAENTSGSTVFQIPAAISWEKGKMRCHCFSHHHILTAPFSCLKRVFKRSKGSSTKEKYIKTKGMSERHPLQMNSKKIKNLRTITHQWWHMLQQRPRQCL